MGRRKRIVIQMPAAAAAGRAAGAWGLTATSGAADRALPSVAGEWPDPPSTGEAVHQSEISSCPGRLVARPRMDTTSRCNYFT